MRMTEERDIWRIMEEAYIQQCDECGLNGDDDNDLLYFDCALHRFHGSFYNHNTRCIGVPKDISWSDNGSLSEEILSRLR